MNSSGFSMSKEIFVHFHYWNIFWLGIAFHIDIFFYQYFKDITPLSVSDIKYAVILYLCFSILKVCLPPLPPLGLLLISPPTLFLFCWACWISKHILSIKFGNFGAIISSNIPHPFEASNICNLGHLKWSHMLTVLCFLKKFFFLCVFISVVSAAISSSPLISFSEMSNGLLVLSQCIFHLRHCSFYL